MISFILLFVELIERKTMKHKEALKIQLYQISQTNLRHYYDKCLLFSFRPE